MQDDFVDALGNSANIGNVAHVNYLHRSGANPEKKQLKFETSNRLAMSFEELGTRLE